MSIFVQVEDRLVHLLNRQVTLRCPHCRSNAHMSPVSVPRLEFISPTRPDFVGVVYRCDSCSQPVFIKYAVRRYSPEQVELFSQFTEIERAAETFQLNGPSTQRVEALFNEALACYDTDCLNAFASMCRRTSQAVFDDLGQGGKLNVFDKFADACALAELDETTMAIVRKVVFDSDADGRSSLPDIDGDTAGILLELMKDMLYETYVRRGRLRRAIGARRRETLVLSPQKAATGDSLD